MEHEKFPAASLRCYLGPMDGDTLTVGAGQWRVEMPGGAYWRCGLSDLRGQPMIDDALLWRAAPDRGEPTP